MTGRTAAFPLPAVAAALALLAGCTARPAPGPAATIPTTTISTVASQTTLVVAPHRDSTTMSGVCPDPVVVQLAGPVDIWALPIVGAVAVDGAVVAPGRYVAALLDPRTVIPTGIRLELRTAAALVPGGTMREALRDDPGILLADVVVDRSAVPADLTRTSRTTTTGTAPIGSSLAAPGDAAAIAVMTPWERGDGAIAWERAIEADATAIADLTGAVDVSADPPFATYLVRSGLLPSQQVIGAELPKRVGGATAARPTARYVRLLEDPTLLAAVASDATAADGGAGSPVTSPIAFQLVDETGWEPYEHALATTAANTRDRTACLHALVPLLQDATARLVTEPERIIANAARIAGKLTEPFDIAVVTSQLSVAKRLRILGTGANKTLGDLEEARLEQVVRADAIRRGLRGSAVPTPPRLAAIARTFADRSFTDPLIGLTPRPSPSASPVG